MRNDYCSFDSPTSAKDLKSWHPKVEHSNFFCHEGMVLTMFHSGHIKFYKVRNNVANPEDFYSDNWYMTEYVFSTIKDSRIFIDLEYMVLHFLHCNPQRAHYVCRYQHERWRCNTKRKTW